MSRAALTVLALGLATAASAQPLAPDAAPVAGTLSPDGTAASVSFAVRTSTEIPLSQAGCTGYLDPSAPDAVVDWGGGDLRVWVRATFDATMAVHRPDGTWACDDDTEGVLPVVEIRSAPAGRYAVWLGAFAPDPDEPQATLYAGTPPPRRPLDASAAPLAGTIEAVGGFEADQGSLTLSGSAGGPDAVEGVDLGDPDAFCVGYIDAARPTAAIDYDADGGTGVLTVGASAVDEDLVLVVQGPDGVACNDDFDGTDPLVHVYEPASGTYAVWVGTYGAAMETVDATLTVGETDRMDEGMFIGDDYDYEPTPFSEGTYVPIDLDAVPAARLSADDTDGDSVGVTVRPSGPNPVQGTECSGFVEPGATATLELRGDGPFAITASSESDLTLLIRTPGGGWFCSDDADGLDPGVQIDAPEAGRYLVWVGAFSTAGDEAPVEATVSAAPGEIVVTSAYDDIGYGGEPQSEGDYTGSEIVAGPGGVALAAGGGETAEVEAGGTVLNPVVGEACHGFLSAGPSATVDTDGDEVTVSATGDEDLTMVVQAPDGTWTCSDDADGSDPAATVVGGPGTYSVWIGTYYRRTEPAMAMLRVE
ncbi:hypothetical protein [Rubrivirga sp.]|uniref:hypothetical protein n=1 Tax=Rubrivirga sp. TaxID=1885344 RepID=UPI003B52E69B